MREALVTLLSPADQARVASAIRLRLPAPVVASSPSIILVFAVIGIATSLHRGAVISTSSPASLAGEQIYRLAILRRRPAGSILGIAARPFVRKLL